MINEEQVRESLAAAFPQAASSIIIARERRMFIDIAPEDFSKFLAFAHDTLEFTVFCTITGMDLGEKLQAAYHIARMNGLVLTVKVSVPRSAPALASICDVFPAAILSERELIDLLGFSITGLPEGKRYPLPDEWPAGEYPLRKDWKPKEGAALTPPAPGSVV